MHEGQGDLLQEKIELSKTLELLPDCVRVRLDLADALLRTDNSKAALQTLNEATANQKRIVRYVIARTWALLSIGDQVEARRNVDAST